VNLLDADRLGKIKKRSRFGRAVNKFAGNANMLDS
jgi:hypothetical protein